jgi:hypothetical protein
MNQSEMMKYKWLDAQEMRPQKSSDDAQKATNKLLQKVLEMFVVDL